MDLASIKKRIASGEGVTIPELREMLAFIEGEKLDLPAELQKGMGVAVRCIRAIMEYGESETAKIQAAKFWVELFNQTVITDTGTIEISFDLMDAKSAAKSKEENADGIQD